MSAVVKHQERMMESRLVGSAIHAQTRLVPMQRTMMIDPQPAEVAEDPNEPMARRIIAKTIELIPIVVTQTEELAELHEWLKKVLDD